jgi:hypothetical protein
VEVVGVIGDVKYDQMASEMGANVYLSYLQSGYSGYYVNLRTAGDPRALTEAVRTAVAAVLHLIVKQGMRLVVAGRW